MTYSWFFHGGRLDSFEELISKLPEAEFSSPTRSTLPLVDFWRSPSARLEVLWRVLGLPSADVTELRFEHPTPVRAGTGKSSFTDLMILSPFAAIAIEAKWTEPPYETVSEWLTPHPTPNRRAVLEGWLQTIDAVAGCRLNVEAVAALPYQLIHRAASACCSDAPSCWLVYQVFARHCDSYYCDQLAAFRELLPSHSPIGLAVLDCELNLLVPLLDTTPKSIRSVMLSAGLFSFAEPRATIIKAAA